MLFLLKSGTFFALFINRTKSFQYQKFCFIRLSYISCKIQTLADNISTKTPPFASPTPPIDKKVSINVMCGKVRQKVSTNEMIYVFVCKRHHAAVAISRDGCSVTRTRLSIGKFAEITCQLCKERAKKQLRFITKKSPAKL